MRLETIFGETGHVTAWQECARAALIFVYGLLLIRLAGRRLFAKWAALDIIVSILIGSNLSRALTGSAELWGTILATTLLVVFHWLLAHLAARSTRLSWLIEGRPVFLSAGGWVEAKLLTRHAISDADLNEAVRAAGLDDADQVRSIVLEPSGKLAVLKPH